MAKNLISKGPFNDLLRHQFPQKDYESLIDIISRPGALEKRPGADPVHCYLSEDGNVYRFDGTAAIPMGAAMQPWVVLKAILAESPKKLRQEIYEYLHNVHGCRMYK